jgi:hydrogenase expression/formation protein HypE
MKKVVYSYLGSPSRRIVVAPGRGVDCGIISVGGRRVMIVTADPISAIPALGMKLSAWLSVHLIASDYTTAGARPEFATFEYNFPTAMSPSERKEYVRVVGNECKNLGVAIVAGNTGSYPGGGFTVIGAGSMLGFCGERSYVTTSMARPGDSIFMTKHAAIEASATLARSFPFHTEKEVGRALAESAREMIVLCSTVADAVAAAGVGLRKDGITSMHDASEGGVLGGLEEMASACRCAFEVDIERIPVSAEARGVCSAFGIDPLTSLAEGSLLITCRPGATEELRKSMRRARIAVAEIGSVRKGTGLWISRGRGKAKPTGPPRDGYWRAYDRSVSLGLN